jgi:hypothetical protein
MKAILGVALVAGFAASTRAQAPRPSPAAIAPAVITISGRVIADVTGDPIANARVTLSPESRTSPVTLTDLDGRFSLTAPAGRYGVVTSKTGYARRETTPAIAGAMTEIRLKKGVAISGRVVDVFGDPVQGVRLAIRRSTGGGKSLDGSLIES